ALGVILNRSPISRTVGGTPCLAWKLRMKLSTSCWRPVSSRMPCPPVARDITQLVLTSQQKRVAGPGDDLSTGLRGFPGLADGARQQALIAGVGDVLEVRALGLGDSGDPRAIALVQEPRAPLGAEGLAGLGGRDRLRVGRHRCIADRRVHFRRQD